MSAESSGASNVDASIDAVSKQVRQMQATYAAMRRQVMFFSLAIIAVLAIFGVATISAAKQNLSSDKIAAAAANRAQTLLPKAQEQLIIGLKDAAPTYQKLAFERFQASLPAVEERITALSKTLPQEINDDLQREADGVLHRVSKKIEADLHREFPKMTHDQLEKLGAKLETQLALSGEVLRDHVNGLVSLELVKLDATLKGFPIDQYAAMDHDKLSRQLIHQFLMLVDYEVQVAGTPDGLDQASTILKLQ